jgi:hypothetical protein
MFEIDLGDVVFKLDKIVLRGYNGMDLISLISDYLKTKGAYALLESDDVRVIKLKELELSKSGANAEKLEAINKEVAELNIANASYFQQLIKDTAIDFKSLFEFMVANVFTYFKIDKKFNDPELWTLYDLLLILECLCKEPRNNLTNFLELLRSQMGVVA